MIQEMISNNASIDKITDYIKSNTFDIDWTKVNYPVLKKYAEDYLSGSKRYLYYDTEVFYVMTEFGNIHSYFRGNFTFFPSNCLFFKCKQGTACIVTEDNRVNILRYGQFYGKLANDNILEASVCYDFGVYLNKDSILNPFILEKKDEEKELACINDDILCYCLGTNRRLCAIRNDCTVFVWNFMEGKHEYAPEDKFLYVDSFGDNFYGITITGSFCSFNNSGDDVFWDITKFKRIIPQTSYYLGIDINNDLYFMDQNNCQKIASNVQNAAASETYFCYVSSGNIYFHNKGCDKSFYVFDKEPIDDIVCNEENVMCLAESNHIIMLTKDGNTFDGGYLKSTDKDDSYLTVLDKCLIVYENVKHHCYFGEMEEILKQTPDTFHFFGKGIFAPFLRLFPQFGYLYAKRISSRGLIVSKNPIPDSTDSADSTGSTETNTTTETTDSTNSTNSSNVTNEPEISPVENKSLNDQNN